MITIFSHIFSFDKMPENKRRGAYGMLCGIVGIVLNLLLCAGKFFAGIVSHSIAITADAVNKLLRPLLHWLGLSWQDRSRIRSIRLVMGALSTYPD